MKGQDREFWCSLETGVLDNTLLPRIVWNIGFFVLQNFRKGLAMAVPKVFLCGDFGNQSVLLYLVGQTE